jgi:xylulokinase
MHERKEENLIIPRNRYDCITIMPKVLGVDSSSQATKIVLCDAETGTELASARASHLDATEIDPAVWWDAFQAAFAQISAESDAIAVGGQQHGMVALDASGNVLRPALLWNDVRSAPDAVDLIEQGGGSQWWADAVGSVLVASFTVTKLRWLARNEPDVMDRVHTVMLPHDYITAKLTNAGVEGTTDRGDASGTGYWSPASGEYRHDIIKLAAGKEINVPRVIGPSEIAGRTPNGTPVAAGTGDNMAAALGLDLQPGDVLVSLGTSGTACAVSQTPPADATGDVAGFADATGRYLPLVCTLNAARVIDAVAFMLGTDISGIEQLALSAPVGAERLVMLPYLDGERTPNLPLATGTLMGLRRDNMTPSNVARAAIEGMICGLIDGVDALSRVGVPVKRALLVGGAAASRAVQDVAAASFDVPVFLPEPREYVARGAARQAAWALSGARNPPQWETKLTELPVAVSDDERRAVRARYAAARDGYIGVSE